jgi:hydroxyacylglutathione hydrolase
MLIRQIVDDALAQYAFLVGCQQTGEALLIDPERDVDRYLTLAAREGLRLTAVAETHIHADFLSGARELAQQLPGVNLYLSAEGGDEWQYEWPSADGANVTWLRDGTRFAVGRIEFAAWHTPGHTPEHMSFVITDRGAGAAEPMGIATGDFVFVGDVGRPDLLESAAGVAGMMEPSARRLYGSARRFLDLPDYLQVWPGHGAGSACGKALGAVPVTTVGYERRTSPAIAASNAGEHAFVDYILRDQPEPPLYFAAMKRLNKAGPPILGSLPKPSRLSLSDVSGPTARRDVQIVDTRVERKRFFDRHLAGSFYAPLDKSFATVVGSLVDPELPIVLVIDEPRIEEAVRALVRIGYDKVPGWVSADNLQGLQAGQFVADIESIDMKEFERRRTRGDVRVLDVRGKAEYAPRHVPGAVNVAHTRLRARLTELPSGEPLYVHCKSGARAAVSAAYLARHGHTVVHVDGDFDDWKPAPSDHRGAAV